MQINKWDKEDLYGQPVMWIRLIRWSDNTLIAGCYFAEVHRKMGFFVV